MSSKLRSELDHIIEQTDTLLREIEGLKRQNVELAEVTRDKLWALVHYRGKEGSSGSQSL